MSQIFSVLYCCLGFSHLPCYNWDFETLCFQYPPPLPLLQYLLCQLQYCQLRQVSSLELLLMSPTCSVTNNTYLCKELYFTKEKHLNSLNMILYPLYIRKYFNNHKIQCFNHRRSVNNNRQQAFTRFDWSRMINIAHATSCRLSISNICLPNLSSQCK